MTDLWRRFAKSNRELTAQQVQDLRSSIKWLIVEWDCNKHVALFPGGHRLKSQ